MLYSSVPICIYVVADREYMGYELENAPYLYLQGPLVKLLYFLILISADYLTQKCFDFGILMLLGNPLSFLCQDTMQ